MYENRPLIRYLGSKQFVMLYGGMRTATRWLARMLNKNVTAKWVKFSHEGWHPNRFNEIDKRWRCGQPGIYGSVGQSGYDHWLYILREFKPKVAFIWREPVSQALSILCHNPKDRRYLPFTWRMYMWFAMYEGVLAATEAASVKANNWHMSHYTTESGFRALCESLDLPVQQNLLMVPKFNSTLPVNRRPIGEFHDYLNNLIEMFPRCKAAREEAEARMRAAMQLA